ncbi:hypothetical protein B0O99DRAFT_606788 [Bisporella sp. PMI_857]|nr:hypothetical protein B0O99DRAFT_606788 [Bisporella sp. PMI_857]
MNTKHDFSQKFRTLAALKECGDQYQLCVEKEAQDPNICKIYNFPGHTQGQCKYIGDCASCGSTKHTLAQCLRKPDPSMTYQKNRCRLL